MDRVLSHLLSLGEIQVLAEIAWWKLLTGRSQVDGEGDAHQELLSFRAAAALRGQPELIDEAELGFPLPPRWTAARLGDITSLITSGSRGWKKYYSASGSSFVRSQDIKLDRLRFEDRVFVRLPGEVEGARTLVQVGDLLLTITGANVGKCAAVLDDLGEAYVSQHVALIRPLVPAWTRFLHGWLTAKLGGRGILEEAQYGLKPGLNLTQLRRLPCPVPPISVQASVVVLGDRIEDASSEVRDAVLQADEIRQKSRASCLQALVNDGEWDRVRDHWDSLFNTPGSVDDLRRAILGLAVRGKLVEPREEDGRASDLIARAKEALQVYAARKPHRCKLSDPPTKFPIPNTWQWTELQELGIVGPRNLVEDDALAGFVPMAAIDDGFVAGHVVEERPWKQIKKGYTHLANGDIAMAKITPCFQNRKSVVISGLPNGVGAGTTELHVLRPFEGVLDPAYALVFLKSPSFVDEGVPRMTGTAGQKRVPRDYFGACPFPLPPLAEQHRIATKVDELMALCDELEARLRDVKTISEQLAESVAYHTAR